ncbi:MAG: hypothetical protein AABW85_05335, partial [archaeon]
IKEINGVADANTQTSQNVGPLAINFDENASLFEQDLNTFFTGFAGITQFSIDMEKRSATATVSLDQNVEFQQFVSGLKTEL